MGYKVKQRTFNLIFEDEPYAGMHISIRSVPTGQFLKVISGVGVMATIDMSQDFDKSDIQKIFNSIPSIRDLFVIMGRALVSWNLEDDDDPIPAVLSQCRESKKPIAESNCSDHRELTVPCDIEGLLGLDLDLVLAITKAWTNSIAGVSSPLPKSSNSGSSSLEASIPMAPL